MSVNLARVISPGQLGQVNLASALYAGQVGRCHVYVLVDRSYRQDV